MRMDSLVSSNVQRLDKDALVGIYESYSPKLFRYAVRLLGDPDLAEECVAETFSRLLQVIQRGRGPNENVQAYLFRMAHNWITDHYRLQPPVESLDLEFHPDPLGNPSTVVTQQMERASVRRALLQLTPEQRQVIVLRFLEDWKHEEVAAAIGRTPEATRALQHRALTALRNLLLIEE